MRALFPLSGTGPVSRRVPAPADAPSCRVCGRVLRSEASRARRVGPRCWRALTARTAIRVVVPAQTAPDVIPGQTELPLPPIQSAITWSA